jgi:hypothetical protein
MTVDKCDVIQKDPVECSTISPSFGEYICDEESHACPQNRMYGSDFGKSSTLLEREMA